MSAPHSSPSTFSEWLDAQHPHHGPRLSDFDRVRELVRPGDVLLIDGRSRLDARLRRILQTRWTQAALYLGRLKDLRDPSLRATVTEYLPCEPDTQLILRALPHGGIQLQVLPELQGEHLRLCRPRGLGEEDAQTVIRYGLSRLGVVSRLRWPEALFLMLPWGLLPERWRRPLLMRYAGRMLRALNGSTIGEAFSFIQFPVLPLVKRTDTDISRLYRRHPRLFLASDFDHSPYFDVVKYPFVDQTDERQMRLLPWKGSLGVLDDARRQTDAPQFSDQSSE